MKIDKDFAVKVEGKIFTANEINKIVIDGGKFNMVCEYTNGSKFEVSAYTKDVELYSSAINLDVNISAKKMKNAVREAIDQIGGNPYCKVCDEPKSDIEVATPLQAMKKAFREAAEDGEQLLKLIKKYNQDITRLGG